MPLEFRSRGSKLRLHAAETDWRFGAALVALVGSFSEPTCGTARRHEGGAAGRGPVKSRSMSDHQPPSHWGRPPVAYAPPPAREVTASYRLWTGILTWTAVVVATLMAVALVVSVVLLVRADQDTRNAAYGYLALVLWAAIAAAIPVLIAIAVPAGVMRRRVRQQNRSGNAPS